MNLISVSGFLIILLFYCGYFSKLILQRRQGISTDRLGRGDKPKRTLITEIFLKIATFTAAAVQLVSLIAGEKGHCLISFDAVRYAGLVTAIVGTGIFIVAMATMKNSWRAGVDASQQTAMIRIGIYRISRNPAFLGFDLFYIGFTLSFCNPATLMSLIFCAVMLHLQILEEEKYLPLAFGKEYEDYRKSVPRYFVF